MAHTDLDALLNALLPFARQMLAKYGEFHPFGASMNHKGEVSITAAHTDQEHPASNELIELLEAGLRQAAEKGEIRAAGICLNVRVSPPGETKTVDAVHARLEHKSGQAANVFLPYRRGFLGSMKYGKLFAAKGTPLIFV